MSSPDPLLCVTMTPSDRLPRAGAGLGGGRGVRKFCYLSMVYNTCALTRELMPRGGGPHLETVPGRRRTPSGDRAHRATPPVPPGGGAGARLGRKTGGKAWAGSPAAPASPSQPPPGRPRVARLASIPVKLRGEETDATARSLSLWEEGALRPVSPLSSPSLPPLHEDEEVPPGAPLSASPVFARVTNASCFSFESITFSRATAPSGVNAKIPSESIA